MQEVFTAAAGFAPLLLCSTGLMGLIVADDLHAKATSAAPAAGAMNANRVALAVAAPSALAILGGVGVLLSTWT